MGTIVSNWISCYWNVFWPKLFQDLANTGDMGLQEYGQTIIFLNEEEDMNCKIILKRTLTDCMVPATLKYPSHNLCEVPCVICISYWKDWGAKNQNAMVLSVTAMKDSLFCSTAMCLTQGEISCVSLRLEYAQKMENVGSRRAQITSDKNTKIFSQVILLVERKTKTYRGICDCI